MGRDFLGEGAVTISGGNNFHLVQTPCTPSPRKITVIIYFIKINELGEHFKLTQKFLKLFSYREVRFLKQMLMVTDGVMLECLKQWQLICMSFVLCIYSRYAGR